MAATSAPTPDPTGGEAVAHGTPTLGTPTPGQPPVAQRLAVIIVSESDAGRLLERMVRSGFPATKVGSTGGFLRRGNVTLLSGIPASQVDALMALVRAECRARTEVVPVQNSPFFGDTDYIGSTVRVRIGGATVFILDVLQFEQS